MNLADSSVVYCVSGLSCPKFSAVPNEDLRCCVYRSSKTSAPSCKPLFIVFEPGGTRMLFVCSSFSCQRNQTHQPKPVCVSDRESERRLQRSMPLFLRKVSTVVKNPGSTRPQTLTLNVSRINCSRPFALTPEMAGMKPSPQQTPHVFNVAFQYHHGTNASF